MAARSCSTPEIGPASNSRQAASARSGSPLSMASTSASWVATTTSGISWSPKAVRIASRTEAPK